MSWEMHEAAKKIAGGWYSELEEISKRNAVLGRENVKLRELVRDWREFAVGGVDSLTDWNHQQAELEHRMRELGIEVDG